MSATRTISNGAPVLPETARQSRCDSVSEKPLHFRPIYEPKRQFWELINKVVLSLFTGVEASLAGLFLAAALLGIATSFAELSRLLERDAISHVAEKAINEFNQNQDTTRLLRP